jgi:hypothetical protein
MLIVPTIYSYLAFYSLYNYGLNNALKELLYLYVNIINTEFEKKIQGNRTVYNLELQYVYSNNILLLGK